MAVYVDPIGPCLLERNWQWRKSCHLFADTLDELHEFAKRLGLKRAWFRPHPRMDHYDLTINMRYKAVRLGAVEVDAKTMVSKMKPPAAGGSEK